MSFSDELGAPPVGTGGCFALGCSCGLEKLNLRNLDLDSSALRFSLNANDVCRWTVCLESVGDGGIEEDSEARETGNGFVGESMVILGMGVGFDGESFDAAMTSCRRSEGGNKGR